MSVFLLCDDIEDSQCCVPCDVWAMSRNNAHALHAHLLELCDGAMMYASISTTRGFLKPEYFFMSQILNTISKLRNREIEKCKVV